MSDKRRWSEGDLFDARVETADEPAEPPGAGDELKYALLRWEAPGTPDSLERRALASYRAEIRAVPFWRRAFTSSIPVPVPAALAALLLLSFAAPALLRNPALGAQQTPPLVVERVVTVEVPVTKTEVVTRVVYRDRARSQSGRPGTRSNSAGAKNMTLAVVNREDTQGLFTGTDLSGFQLNEAMSLKVIKKAEAYEK
jgi:hypothetical protein